MGKAFCNLLNLYPGEEKKSVLFLLLGFLWATGSYGNLVLSEGLFLEKMGAHGLLLCYTLMAVALCLLSTFFITALNHFSKFTLFFVLLVAGLCSNLIFSFTYCFFPLITETPFFLYAFKIIQTMMPIAVYISFWAYCDQFFDLQEGKRFFSLFNAQLFLGDAVGGLAIATLISHLSFSSMLLLFAAFYVGALFVLKYISAQNFDLLTPHPKAKEEKLSYINIFKTIRSSSFTWQLLLFYFVMQLLVVTTEFSYMNAFEHYFKKSSTGNALTEFLGLCSMWISLCNTLFALLIYSRAVKRLGINNIILIAPFFFLGLFAFWHWHECFLIALLALIAREGMSYTFDDNNLLLLLSGVPSRIKNQVRVMIEAFFEPIAMMGSVLLLFKCEEKSKMIALIIAGAGLIIALFLRSSYPRAFFQTLIDHSLRFEKRAAHWFRSFSPKERRRIDHYLLQQLRLGDEESKLHAFEAFLNMENGEHLPHMLNHLNKLSLPAKLRTIDLLSQSIFANKTCVVEHLERWRRTHAHPALQSKLNLMKK